MKTVSHSVCSYVTIYTIVIPYVQRISLRPVSNYLHHATYQPTPSTYLATTPTYQNYLPTYFNCISSYRTYLPRYLPTYFTCMYSYLTYLPQLPTTYYYLLLTPSTYLATSPIYLQHATYLFLYLPI